MALKDLINPRPVSEPDEKGEVGSVDTRVLGSGLEDGTKKVLTESQVPRGVAEVVTPSGIQIYYQSGPKRLYRVTPPGGKVFEPPSWSNIDDILAKGGLTWWAMKATIQSIITLLEIGRTREVTEEDLSFLTCREDLGLLRVDEPWDNPYVQDATVENVVALLKQEKLTVNDVRDKAGDRGTSVHTALELWAEQGIFPNPEIYAEEEQGYVRGLCKFLNEALPTAVASEVMVASVKHKYAGRYDLDAEIPDGVEVFTHITPKGRGDKKEAIEGGLWRIDLKTSGAVYDSYHLQIEAYEEAARECGYPGTENRGILRVTEDGRYELKRSKATFADFKAVLSAFKALQRVKAR